MPFLTSHPRSSPHLEVRLTAHGPQAEELRSHLEPTGFINGVGADHAHVASTSILEAIHGKDKTTQPSSTNRTDRVISPEHPDVIALRLYKAALEEQYDRGLSDLKALLRDQDAATIDSGSSGFTDHIPELPRCPDIDWSKYWVSGMGLEGLHNLICSGKIDRYPDSTRTEPE